MWVWLSTSASLSSMKNNWNTAHYDALTGIPNRVLLADRMNQAIVQANRNKSLLGICYLDIDGFKSINDLGHPMGDMVLVEISRRIANSIRKGDTVARLGGDEFVVLLPDLKTIEECIAALNRLHEIIALPILMEKKTIALTTSIGISIFPGDNKDPDELLPWLWYTQNYGMLVFCL